ncbi:DUF4837 family protein [Rubrivirga sp.]|uniref:DUF4837 family protein n=1 Tax=Rubrivirga sp. TaxID=1885344 RepID=UPI003C72BCF6
MNKLLLIPAALLAIGLSACETVEAGQPQARGETEEIVVVTDSVTWAGPVGDAIRAELGKPILTLPSNQGAFQLRHQELTGRGFPSLKMAPNIIFAAPVDAPGEIGDFIRSRVGESNLEAVRSGSSAAVNLRDDLWANNQLVTIATAASDSALATQFLQRGPELRERYEDLARVRTGNEIYARLRQTDLEDELLAAHDFQVGIQHDYVPVQDTSATAGGLEGEFVRYRRVLVDTWRDFYVFYADGVDTLPSEADLDGITNDLLEEFARGVLDSSYVEIDDQRPTSTDEVEINGRPGVEKRGFWRMTYDVMGGSYIRFAFLDPATDRLYVYYGMTFAPDRTLDKRKFLRQMEAIGHSFVSAADLEPTGRRSQDAPPE